MENIGNYRNFYVAMVTIDDLQIWKFLELPDHKKRIGIHSITRVMLLVLIDYNKLII